MRQLIERAGGMARKTQRRRIAGIVRRAQEEVQGVRVQAQESAVVIKGQGLIRRWLEDPALRFLAENAP
jgi:hypothetical protein